MSAINRGMLLIEDYKHYRDNVLQNFGRRKLLDDVEAPTSGDECSAVFTTVGFTCALIDYKLVHWVGENSNNPINLDGVNCYNGVELATWLLRKTPEMKIGLYSSFEDDLEEQLRKSDIFDKVEIVTSKGVPINDLTKPLREFAQKNIQTPIIIKPLHRSMAEIPQEVQLYQSRKILGAKKEGEQLWKAGKYAWLAGINTSIPSYAGESNELPGDWTLDNPEEKYAIKLNREGQLNWLVEEASHTILNYSDVEEMMLSEGPSDSEFHLSKPIFSLFAARVFSNAFMQEAFGWDELPLVSRMLSPLAKFETQKILYKEIRSSMKLGLGSKEDIYAYLSPFMTCDFPKILDVFKGRVDKIAGDTAYVKLDSYSPEGAVMKEQFSLDFLEDNHLEESSEFEYTVYQPSLGGTAYLIEPL